jgi:hypothetical protein
MLDRRKDRRAPPLRKGFETFDLPALHFEIGN